MPWILVRRVFERMQYKTWRCLKTKKFICVRQQEIFVWSKAGYSPGSICLPALPSSAGMASSSWWQDGCCTSRPCIPSRKKSEWREKGENLKQADLPSLSSLTSFVGHSVLGGLLTSHSPELGLLSTLCCINSIASISEEGYHKTSE